MQYLLHCCKTCTLHHLQSHLAQPNDDSDVKQQQKSKNTNPSPLPSPAYHAGGYHSNRGGSYCVQQVIHVLLYRVQCAGADALLHKRTISQHSLPKEQRKLNDRLRAVVGEIALTAVIRWAVVWVVVWGGHQMHTLAITINTLRYPWTVLRPLIFDVLESTVLDYAAQAVVDVRLHIMHTTAHTRMTRIIVHMHSPCNAHTFPLVAPTRTHSFPSGGPPAAPTRVQQCDRVACTVACHVERV